MPKKREIRNSTAEFLTFVAEGKENGIQVLYRECQTWVKPMPIKDYREYMKEHKKEAKDKAKAGKRK